MDQNFNNNENDFLWTLLANPAVDANSYNYNLQRLVSDHPQSGVLQALLARSSGEKNLRQAATYYSPAALYKLINDPSLFAPVTDEKITIRKGIASQNGHQNYVAPPVPQRVPEPEVEPETQPVPEIKPEPVSESVVAQPPPVEPVIEPTAQIVDIKPQVAEQYVGPAPAAGINIPALPAPVAENNEYISIEERIQNAIRGAHQALDGDKPATPPSTPEINRSVDLAETALLERLREVSQPETPQPVSIAETAQPHITPAEPEIEASQPVKIEEPAPSFTPPFLSEIENAAETVRSYSAPEPVKTEEPIAQPAPSVATAEIKAEEPAQADVAPSVPETVAPEPSKTEEPIQGHVTPVAVVEPEPAEIAEPVQSYIAPSVPEIVAGPTKVAEPAPAFVAPQVPEPIVPEPVKIAEPVRTYAAPEPIKAEEPVKPYSPPVAAEPAMPKPETGAEPASWYIPVVAPQSETAQPVKAAEPVINTPLIDAPPRAPVQPVISQPQYTPFEPPVQKPAPEPEKPVEAPPIAASYTPPVDTGYNRFSVEREPEQPVSPPVEKPVGESPKKDLFSFDQAFAARRFNRQPNAPEEPAKPAPAPEKQAAPGAAKDDQSDVSKYHDEKMPYTFMWWLDKTRKEHASIYQPYIKPQTTVAVAKPKAKTDELQQQYYENIFHITSVEELDKTAPPPPAQQKAETVRKEHFIIERFIKEEPQIKPQSSDKIDNENKAKKSSEDRDEMVTETLADIYTQQMLYHKAIASYKKLMLKFPEKSRYFAEKIEQLEKKTY